MQDSALLSQVMPVALGIIMLGLGLSLTLDDFRRVTKYPRAISIALTSQLILLPALCWLLVNIFAMQPAYGVGLMLLSASPGGEERHQVAIRLGGVVGEPIHHLGGEIAMDGAAVAQFPVHAQHVAHHPAMQVPMPIQKVVEVFAIVLTPVILGMVIRNASPHFAARMDRPVKVASVLFLALIILTLTIQQRALLGTYIIALGMPVLVFNLISLSTGYFLPQLFKVEKKQAIAIGMEIGIHNATLAIYIALNVLNETDMSIAPALYGLLMFITAAGFGFLVSRGVPHPERN